MGFGASIDAGYATAGPRLGGAGQSSSHMAYNQPSYATDQYQMSNPRTQKVQRLLERTKKMIENQHFTGTAAKGGKMTVFEGGLDQSEAEEAAAKYQSRKIGPFSFDIDDEIDTEVLTSEEVYKDLKELEVILDKETDKVNISSKMLGRSKKKAK